jgi:hypothetical protein
VQEVAGRQQRQVEQLIASSTEQPVGKKAAV